jgi:hypothetical protein
MKRLKNQIMVVLAFLISACFVSQAKAIKNVNKIIEAKVDENLVADGSKKVVVDRNPFLIEKRHGAFALIARYPKDTSFNKKLVAEKNPFLVEKRHGTVLKISDIISDVHRNLVVERNPFLVGKHRGVVYTVKSNTKHTYKQNKDKNVRNIFLDQKRHQ